MLDERLWNEEDEKEPRDPEKGPEKMEQGSAVDAEEAGETETRGKDDGDQEDRKPDKKEDKKDGKKEDNQPEKGEDGKEEDGEEQQKEGKVRPPPRFHGRLLVHPS